MIDIKIGTNCPLLNDLGDYCYEEQTMGLGINADEITIFKILNHEILHAVIGERENEKTARLFDKTFQNKHGKVVRFTLDDGTPKF